MKTIRMVEFDGADGVGKSTQMHELKKLLRKSGTNVYETKLLGGDGTCEYQKAFRKILLHKKFPSDSVEFEEACFAETDLQGIQMAREALTVDPGTVCIKDRSLASHVVYALAKGMSMESARECHREVIRQNQLLNRDFGSVHLIFVPDRVEWLLARIQKRAEADGVEVVERLENAETQTRVCSALQNFKNWDVSQGLNVEVIQVAEADTVMDVHGRVVEALAGKYALPGLV